MSQYRNWCFTLNSPTVLDATFWDTLDEWEHKGIIQYVVLQQEVGENGTDHLQGYIELKGRARLTRMKNLFGDRYHFENRRGTQEQAIAYCTKTDTRVQNGLQITWGTPKRTGAGGKFKDAIHALTEGMAIEDLVEEFPTQHAMWRDKLETFALSLKGKRHWAMDIVIYVGATGTGKSYTADLEEDHYKAPWPTGGRWWWPTYRGENTVVLDEFRHQIKMDVMLKMFDRYDWHLESKGNNFHFVSKKIVITTNVDPKDWYPNLTRETKAPLARRINEFAKIFDFAAGVFPNFTKRLRTEEFVFNQRQIPYGNFRDGNPRGGGYAAMNS